MYDEARPSQEELPTSVDRTTMSERNVGTTTRAQASNGAQPHVPPHRMSRAATPAAETVSPDKFGKLKSAAQQRANKTAETPRPNAGSDSPESAKNQPTDSPATAMQSAIKDTAGQIQKLAAEIAEGEVGTVQNHNEATESETTSGQSSQTESDAEDALEHQTGDVDAPQEQTNLGNPTQLEAAMEEILTKISGYYALMEKFPTQHLRYDAKVMQLEHEYGMLMAQQSQQFNTKSAANATPQEAIAASDTPAERGYKPSSLQAVAGARVVHTERHTQKVNQALLAKHGLRIKNNATPEVVQRTVEDFMEYATGVCHYPRFESGEPVKEEHSKVLAHYVTAMLPREYANRISAMEASERTDITNVVQVVLNEVTKQESRRNYQSELESWKSTVKYVQSKSTKTPHASSYDNMVNKCLRKLESLCALFNKEVPWDELRFAVGKNIPSKKSADGTHEPLYGMSIWTMYIGSDGTGKDQWMKAHEATLEVCRNLDSFHQLHENKTDSDQGATHLGAAVPGKEQKGRYGKPPGKPAFKKTCLYCKFKLGKLETEHKLETCPHRKHIDKTKCAICDGNRDHRVQDCPKSVWKKRGGQDRKPQDSAAASVAQEAEEDTQATFNKQMAAYLEARKEQRKKKPSRSE